MISCKRCNDDKVVKNGFVRGLQRYKCNSCGFNFVQGDSRVKHETSVKRAFAVLLYSLGKSSYGFIARLFGVTRPAVQKWLQKESLLLDNPDVCGDIKEIEFDEMWHFIQSKKTKNGLSRPWIVAQGEPLPGFSAVVMLQHSGS